MVWGLPAPTEALPPGGPLTCQWPQAVLLWRGRGKSPDYIVFMPGASRRPVEADTVTEVRLSPPSIPWQIVQSSILLAHPTLDLPKQMLRVFTIQCGGQLKEYLPVGMPPICVDSPFCHGAGGPRAWREVFYTTLLPRNPIFEACPGEWVSAVTCRR